VIDKVEGGFNVKVGSLPHPMEGNHYLVWVGIIHYPNVYQHFFKPGEVPEAIFKVDAISGTMVSLSSLGQLVFFRTLSVHSKKRR
jgi:desulfoferrodoxin